mgnify:CR=1 FL=1
MKKKVNGIWFFGYSGAGKTFASKLVSKKIKNSIVIDGDDIRKYISYDLTYIKKDRIIQTKRILGFAKICINQNFFPIISTSFLSKGVSNLVKKNNIKIIEIKRNKSELFKKVKSQKNVVGIDIFYENFPRKKIFNDKNFLNKINKLLNFLSS